ncbi:MAG TPA: putative metal-dependent hydrolase, partial [Gemmatimonadaceae bacterium]|nr:putative metal-dependent hydrolase [Gemmatimonadaceae bacterium]
QYPVGRFTAPDQVTDVVRDTAIREVADAPAAMRAAVAGLNPSQVETPYRDGGWTVRQVVHHVADSHMHAYIRFKFALTEENPTIRPYDEAAWAVLPDVASQPIEVSLALIDGIHARWVACMREMTPAQFSRAFVHPELGPQPVDLSLLRYAWHGRHHVAHVTALRQRMGW